MRKTEDQKTTATNADLFLIKRNTEAPKTTARNADLLLIIRILKPIKQLKQIQIYF